MKLERISRILCVAMAWVMFSTAYANTTETPKKVETQVEATTTEEKEELTEVTVEKEEANIVTTPLEDTVEEEVVEEIVEEVVPTPEELEQQEWQNYMMPNVEEYLNVRVEPNAEAELAGKLEKGDRASVLEKGEEWTKIESGSLVGYVSNEYSLFGTDALAYAKENCKTIATTNTDGLRIREEMSTESRIVKRLEEGEKLTVDTSTTTDEGWVAVKHNDETCYVAAEYVDVAMEIGTGMTIEEIEELARQEAERKAKEEQAKREAAEKVASDNNAIKEVDELTLMAAIIYCEAGAEPYETQLAVGAVIMNRIESGNFPNTLYGVISARGQFTPYRSGALAKAIIQGKAKDSCYEAARAAMAGEDNTDGCLYFNDYNGSREGIRYGGMVFWW